MSPIVGLTLDTAGPTGLSKVGRYLIRDLSVFLLKLQLDFVQALLERFIFGTRYRAGRGKRGRCQRCGNQSRTRQKK